MPKQIDILKVEKGYNVFLTLEAEKALKERSKHHE